ncbi:MAG: NAD-dependent epimerase [Gammaproteobacteria bacterium]|nr:NAD-dependent epimerase [Gammaproteobacteria bacterium]NVK89608.1 NAD-dependent epimerase [Gammaproteobacteria bacterium]
MMSRKILVTGAAGFIGSHVSHYLLDRGDTVVGLDNLNDYYDVNLKLARLERLQARAGFSFVKLDVADKTAIAELFEQQQFDDVVHLAAQAGVRYSIENPHAYMDANIIGHLNILEGCRHNGVNHLVYASSSSVYGANTLQPFSEHHNVDHPVSLYAASKKANELMSHTYSNLYNMKTTGLRFFTVYGPWGRPDMALFLFTKGILEGNTIDIYNNGDMIRDFTYIDDIVEGVVRVLDAPPQGNPEWSGDKPDPATSFCQYRVFNIGNNNPVKLMDFVNAIERAVGKEAKKNLMPMQPGDVPSTSADVSELEKAVGFKPNTSVETGINNFVKWYREFYNC